MTGKSSLQVTIDISQVDLELEPEELESLTSSVKDEITDIVEEVICIYKEQIIKSHFHK